MQNFEVKMVHEELSRAPVFELPRPFSFGFYEPGREDDWLRIHEQADKFNLFTPFVFRDQFQRYAAILPSCQFYLLNADGEPVGTATACPGERTAGSGRVHWVAIVPRYQGLKLAKPLLSAVCQKLLEQGFEKGSLSTSTARLNAIMLYLKFGFKPLIQSEEDELHWAHFTREAGLEPV